jgi:hypothetical protein
MHTYRVDFDPGPRTGDQRTRLMRDIRKVAARTRKADGTPARYVWKRRTDGTLGYWFQFDNDVLKDAEARKLLEPHGVASASPPVLPQSEWKRI